MEVTTEAVEAAAKAAAERNQGDAPVRSGHTGFWLVDRTGG
jgi:hypothetical protein